MSAEEQDAPCYSDRCAGCTAYWRKVEDRYAEVLFPTDHGDEPCGTGGFQG